MRPDYVYDPDPKVRARNKGQRAVDYINEEVQKGVEMDQVLWRKVKSRFLYDLNSRYKDTDGPQVHQAVKEYWQNLRQLNRTATVLDKAKAGKYGGGGISNYFFDSTQGTDTLDQLKILFTLAKHQTKAGIGDEEE